MENVQVDDTEHQTIDLRVPTIDLRKVKIGTIVITSKGFSFELFSRKKGKESWKDLKTKLIWYDIEEGNFTHIQAVDKFGNSLPSIEEFKTAETHGFREVCPNITGNYFWSSSLYPSGTDYAQVFSGNNGFSYFGIYRVYYGSVRCVGR